MAQHTDPTPLTEEHYHSLNSALEACSLADELIGRCQSAGLDVNKQVRRAREQRQIAEGIKREFFPHRP